MFKYDMCMYVRTYACMCENDCSAPMRTKTSILCEVYLCEKDRAYRAKEKAAKVK